MKLQIKEKISEEVQHKLFVPPPCIPNAFTHIFQIIAGTSRSTKRLPLLEYVPICSSSVIVSQFIYEKVIRDAMMDIKDGLRSGSSN